MTKEQALSRRQLLVSSAALGTTMVAGRSSSALSVAKDYRRLDSDKYFGRGTILSTIEDDKVFTEGPAFGPDGNLYFTNVPAEKILRWDPKAKELSVWREQSNKANGLYFAPNGDLLACEGGAGRVTRTDMKTGKITVVASEFNGFPFAAPNDLCMDDKGRIFFTSRPGVEDPTKGNVNAVYRVDPDGSVAQVLAWPDIHMPNGIVTSPDDKKLYLIEAHPDADYHRDIRVYDIADDGALVNEKVHINFYPGRSGDGMCIDAEGNLYVAAGLHETRNTSETLDTRPGIHVISPRGKLVGYAETPEDTITNCTFGGPDNRTLFVTCGTKLVSFRTKIPGKF